MRSSFWIGATGLYQHQQALDVVSHNVSNVNTTAFKGSSIHFQDLFSQTLKLGGAPQAEGVTGVNPVQKGLGVGLAAIQKNFSQGTIDLTNRDLDMAIQGPGFFIVRAPDNLPNTHYYTRDGHFSIDANGGTNPGTGPITLVTSEGYTLQGVNATLDATTGEYVLPTTPALNDITFDPNGALGPFATTFAAFGYNLDATQDLAIDPQVFEQETLGVDRSFRLSFQKAALEQSNGDQYFFFTAQDPAQASDGSYTTLTDPVTGTPIRGIVRIDADGEVAGVYTDNDADGFLTDAEITALAPWSNLNGSGNPFFTVGANPVVVANEAIQRPSGVALTLAAPAAFQVGAGVLDANSTVITIGSRTLVNGVDYTETPGTGTITPLTAWDTGDYAVTYTTNGGTVTVSAEPRLISNASGNQSFIVASPPVQAGSLVLSATRNGAALVEGTDYTIDTTTGKVTPLTFWDPGAVTASYNQADTRAAVEFGVTGLPLSFRNNLTPGESLAIPASRTETEITQGTTMSVFDTAGNEHSLSFSFERLSENRWMWNAVPTYRYEQGSTAITDGATGGGTSLDGMTVMPGALRANADGTYQVEIATDEGGGYVSWTQVPAGSPFPESGGDSRYFRVADPVTGAIEFSRDLDTSPAGFAVKTTYPSATTTGNGVVAFDASGLYDATNSAIVDPVAFTPQGALALAIAPDFENLTQFARKSDVTVTDSNGFAAGTVVSWGIDNHGRIVADYSNGLQQFLGRITMAKYPNPEGLVARGETTYIPSAASGTRELMFGGVNESNGTTFINGALETSNVEMAEELANMILFQRAYQFNSRIITTSDEMIKEAIALKR